MYTPPTRDAVFAALAPGVVKTLARQQSDGGIVAPSIGLPDANTAVVGFVATAGLVYLAQAQRLADFPLSVPPAELLNAATRAADWLLANQRPSGRLDLLTCNYDSGPDAAFALQPLCPLIEFGRGLAERDPDWEAFLSRVERFAYRGAEGMLTGGFHTPNHRWVISGALGQAAAIFPELAERIRPVIASYLAEGIDIDADGMYTERSIGVYDGIVNRSLYLLDQSIGDVPEAGEAARKNLELDLHLLHADGTADTSLSHRQDRGARTVPTGLAESYLLWGFRDNNPVFLKATLDLFDKAGTIASFWLAYALLRYGDLPPVSDTPLPTDFSQHYAHNGLWRVRRGLLTASFFQGGTRLCSLVHGEATLDSVSIHQSYFGVGSFVCDSMTVDEADGTAILRSEAYSKNGRRPGYEMPVGRPVAVGSFYDTLNERDLYALPGCVSEVAVAQTPDGFILHYRTLEGMEGVTAQVAFDFPPGGIWETGDTSFQPQAGQVIFLRQGSGTMRYGDDVIEIGPGADAHRTWNLRDSIPAPGMVRVVIPFHTPIDHTFTLRGRRGL
jgi:hypothetical protein